MADDRIKTSWRNWVSDPLPELAQAYCTEVARADQAPSGTTKLAEIPWDGLGFPKHEQIRVAFERAVEKYVETEWESTFLEDLHWLSACHFWHAAIMSPTIARGVKKVYERYDMTLYDGTEEAAEADAVKSPARGAGTVQKLKKRVALLQEDLNRSMTREANIAEIKRKLDDSKRIEKLRSREVKRLRSDLDRLEKFRKDAHIHSGLKENFRKLQQENERLARIIQGREVAK